MAAAAVTCSTADERKVIMTDVGEQRPSITVMTYNIRYGGGGGEVGRQEADYEENVNKVAGIINEISPDVVALQETNCNGHHTFSMLEEITGMKGSETGNQGILIKPEFHFSERPVRHDFGDDFYHYSRSEVMVERTVYTIFQTHLRRPPFQETESPCQSQLGEKKDIQPTLQQLHKLTSRLWSEDFRKPIIVLGDFNLGELDFK